LATPDDSHSGHALPSGTVLGFDYGERRIGVAVGEWLLRLAHPLVAIDAEDKVARFRAIGALVEEWRPVQLVVGSPRHIDRTPHLMTEACARFARQLEGRYHLPVILVDERLSSRAADLDLREAGHGGRRGKTLRDQAAARIILQSYFDEHGLPAGS
jgi:putative Holliday junction resolvase